MNDEIKRLLAELAKSNELHGSRSNSSRNIRKQLRSRGHRSGLRGMREH
jgi:hypothetical protein